jgi:hypothetical protein
LVSTVIYFSIAISYKVSEHVWKTKISMNYY